MLMPTLAIDKNISESIQPQPHRFTVIEYHQMLELGVLREDDHIELINGELIDMAPMGSWHAATVADLAETLILQLAGRAKVYIQNPIRLDEHNEPQPDLAVLRKREPSYAFTHPGPEDVLLIIEVADSSIRYDRDVKLSLYARYGIPEVWLLDGSSKRLEIYRNPQTEQEDFRDIERHYQGIAAPALLKNVTIDVAELSASR